MEHHVGGSQGLAQVGLDAIRAEIDGHVLAGGAGRRRAPVQADDHGALGLEVLHEVPTEKPRRTRDHCPSSGPRRIHADHGQPSIPKTVSIRFVARATAAS